MSEAFQIIDQLMDNMLSHEKQRLFKEELALVRANREASGTHIDCFFHNGVMFSDLEIKLRAKGKKGPLHRSLHARCEALMKDRATVEFDEARCRQALAIVLAGLTHLQDIRDALPEILATTNAVLKTLSRTREEAWNLVDNARGLRQYTQLRERIDFYMVTKLLY